MTVVTCPNETELAAYLRGEVSAQSLDDISSHIAACTSCLARLDRIDVPNLNLGTGSTQLPAEAPFEAAVTRLMSLGAAVGPGTILRDYRLLEQIGEGGMGSVYKAVHTKLEKTVAVKVIRAGSWSEPAAIVRFEREMRAVGRLHDPHIVEATDAGEHDGIPFLVMEYVEGENLSKLVKANGPFAVAEACELIRQAAVGLQHAHEAGLVHRDVKPGNLIRTPEGRVKILDLGLAVIAEEAVEGVGEASASTVPGHAEAELTSASRMVGTRDYMAPEQRRNAHAVDARADVYGLGCTLWYLLTGKPPEVGTALGADPLPGNLPREVWQKLLATEPAERYSTASDVAKALDLTTVRASPRGRRIIAISTLMVAMVVILAVLYWPKPRQDEAPPLIPELPKVASVPPGKLPMTEDEAIALQIAWAAHLGVDVTITNDLGMKLALIPPGELGLSPECRVKITKPYRMQTTEITRGQFRQFCEAEGYVTAAERDGQGGDVFDRSVKYWTEKRKGLTWKNPGDAEVTDDHPVTMISHNDAVAFCVWLSKKEKRTYRLPTEAEWKWACRAGSSHAQPHRGNRELIDTFCWFRGNSGDRAHPVAKLKPNAWGLYDMHGNVAEYTGDPFETLPVGTFDDFAGARNPDVIVVLGTQFFVAAPDFDNRTHAERIVRTSYTGFRVVLVQP